MIRLTKYSLFLFFICSSILFSQKLDSFEVNGNINFEDNEYLRWSGLNLNQSIFPGIIDSVKNRILRNLLAYGYFYSVFEKSEIVLSPDSAKFKIIIDIKEDSPVIVEKIIFSNSDSLLNHSLIEQFSYLEGNVFNKEDLESNIDKILVNYENSGHPFARVVLTSVIVIRDSMNDQYLAQINVKIETGQENKIDKIEIAGNTSTKDYVILRELRFETGSLYVKKQIDEFPKRLNRLRFFEPVSIPEFYINSKKEGVLVINIKEKNTNNFDGIIGYSPPGKNEKNGYVTGMVDISLRNLFGTGRGIAIKWNKFNRKSQELDLKYLEPWFLSFPLNLNFNIYQRIQDSTYVQRKLEGAVEYLATEDISGSISISAESVVPTVRSKPVFTVYNSSYLTSGVNLKIDTRDDPYSPTEGLLFINSYSYSRKEINGPEQYITPGLQTTVNLQRFAVSFNIFYELFSRQVIAFGVNGRELRSSTFENSDLYRLGGTNTLRGYREEQFLGSRIFWSNLEYRALFTRRSFGFVFFDTGYYLRPAEIEKNILKTEEFLYGFGLGLNLETGLGVLRVSYALGKGDTFSDGKIHFGILNEF